jgi:hypothetical protein
VAIASSCVACASVYRLHASELAGKFPITPAQVREASLQATELLELIAPKGASQENAAVNADIDLRNRMFTLLIQDYDEAFRAGPWLFGNRAGDLVPSAFSFSSHTPQDSVAKAKAEAAKSEKETAAKQSRAKRREAKKAATVEARRIGAEVKKLADAAKRAARKGEKVPSLEALLEQQKAAAAAKPGAPGVTQPPAGETPPSPPAGTRPEAPGGTDAAPSSKPTPQGV